MDRNCGSQNGNDNIETRGKKFIMFPYILTFKIRPREFMDQNIFFTPVMKKLKLNLNKK